MKSLAALLEGKFCHIMLTAMRKRLRVDCFQYCIFVLGILSLTRSGADAVNLTCDVNTTHMARLWVEIMMQEQHHPSIFTIPANRHLLHLQNRTLSWFNSSYRLYYLRFFSRCATHFARLKSGQFAVIKWLPSRSSYLMVLMYFRFVR